MTVWGRRATCRSTSKSTPEVTLRPSSLPWARRRRRAVWRAGWRQARGRRKRTSTSTSTARPSLPLAVTREHAARCQCHSVSVGFCGGPGECEEFFLELHDYNIVTNRWHRKRGFKTRKIQNKLTFSVFVVLGVIWGWGGLFFIWVFFIFFIFFRKKNQVLVFLFVSEQHWTLPNLFLLEHDYACLKQMYPSQSFLSEAILSSSHKTERHQVWLMKWGLPVVCCSICTWRGLCHCHEPRSVEITCATNDVTRD